MQETKAIRNVVLDNKLKKIYQEEEGYQTLNEADQNFFDSIFSILWLQEKIDFTNRYLADMFQYGQSTIEKKLRRIERAELIHREIRRSQDEVGFWQTTRVITLNPFLRVKIAKSLKLMPKGMKKMPEEPVEEQTEEEIIPEEPVEEANSVKNRSKSKLNWTKIRR